MDDKKFLGIMILLVPLLIKEIVDNESISEDSATESLYGSELYSRLENEKTKLWHLSPKALYLLYRQEKDSGYIDYPEEA